GFLPEKRSASAGVHLIRRVVAERAAFQGAECMDDGVLGVRDLLRTQVRIGRQTVAEQFAGFLKQGVGTGKRGDLLRHRDLLYEMTITKLQIGFPVSSGQKRINFRKISPFSEPEFGASVLLQQGGQRLGAAAWNTVLRTASEINRRRPVGRSDQR